MSHPYPASRLRWTALVVVLLFAASACSSPSGAGVSASAAQRTGQRSPDLPLSYVALGDSFTSAPLVPVTDVANGCFRSSANYPALVARELGADLDDRSCGGARLKDLSASQWPDVPPQLSALTPDVGLVTIGIGGNDQKVFAQLTRTCPKLRASDPQGAPCERFMGSSGKDSLLSALRDTRKKLTVILKNVQRQAPNAQVLVIGYPRIVAADRSCAELPLAKGDYPYVAKVNVALDRALRGAAKDSGTDFIDVWKASRGHDICSSDPWVNGSVTDRERAAAYHPFAVEQKAVAGLVVAAVAN